MNWSPLFKLPISTVFDWWPVLYHTCIKWAWCMSYSKAVAGLALKACLLSVSFRNDCVCRYWRNHILPQCTCGLTVELSVAHILFSYITFSCSFPCMLYLPLSTYNIPGMQIYKSIWLVPKRCPSLVGVMSSMATTLNHLHISTRSRMRLVELLVLEVSVPIHILLETQLSWYVAQALLERVECCQGTVTFLKTILDALHWL